MTDPGGRERGSMPRFVSDFVSPPALEPHDHLSLFAQFLSNSPYVRHSGGRDRRLYGVS